jgi:hypothetical protein
MGIIVVGTLYEKNWGGIAFTQPGGPYTQVFPAEAVNVPFTAYPVPGQVFAENSSPWVCGCLHWVDEPMVFQDHDGFTVTFAYLQDSLGRVWQLGVTRGGTDITATQVSITADSTVLLTDQVTSQTWMLTVVPNGSGVNLEIIPVGGSGGQPQLLVLDPTGALFGIQVSNGVLQTAYPLAAEGSEVAIICCPICTYCQYVMPLAQFYDSWKNPVTII